MEEYSPARARARYREITADQLPRTKQDALRTVASYMAGMMQGGTMEEACGLNVDHLTDAEAERISWAIEEVSRRLWAMGGPRK